MIGIINADRTMTWVLKGKIGEQNTVRLRLVRHGQKRIHLRFFWQEQGGPQRVIGTMKFATGIDGFIESPEIETKLRIDSKGRLYVSIDCLGTIIHQRMRLPLRPIDQSGSKTNDKTFFQRYWRHGGLLLLGAAGFTVGIILLAVAL